MGRLPPPGHPVRAVALPACPLTRTAGWVLDRLEGEALCAPAHQAAEVLSALARLHRAGVIDERVAKTALTEAAALRQEFVATSERHLHRALELGGGVRVLDALYVGLAEERRCPLITTDRWLVRSGAPCTLEAPPA